MRKANISLAHSCDAARGGAVDHTPTHPLEQSHQKPRTVTPRPISGCQWQHLFPISIYIQSQPSRCAGAAGDIRDGRARCSPSRPNGGLSGDRPRRMRTCEAALAEGFSSLSGGQRGTSAPDCGQTGAWLHGWSVSGARRPRARRTCRCQCPCTAPGVSRGSRCRS